MSDEYPLMAFIANEGVAPKGERYDRSALVTDTVNKLYKKTEKGDFIYSSNNLETGSIGLNKYGKACISPVYSIFEPTGIADSDFLGRRLVRKDFINAMVKWRQGVIYGQWRIHESDFLKIEITVPSVEEQRKIGAYLDQLDNLITLHQRECISFTARAGRRILTANKKRNTSSWEQRKLGDLLQTLPFKQFLKEPEPDGKYEIIQQGNEPVIGFANGTPCGDYKDVVIFGDHTLSLYKPQHPFFVATDGVRIVKGQQDTDGYYLLSLLERYKPQSEGYKRYYSILADTNCITTYNTSEQEKIGVFFKLLDNLITLHQRKPFLMKWRTSDANRNKTNRLVL